jgi:hypothetical protein
VHLDSQLHLIDAFEAEIEDLDGRIRGLFDADAGYRALLRVAGIGPVFAAILRGRDRGDRPGSPRHASSTRGPG